jgi:signal transduction histidine kinase/ligand-binding sensor domain-containing protein
LPAQAAQPHKHVGTIPYLHLTMKVLLLLFSWFSALICFSQEPLRFKHIMRENGSGIFSIQNFHQDKQGFMWMASTQNDLIRFDGTNFRYYGFADFDTTQFRSSRGVLTFEDRNQQLWVGTDAGALFKYNRDKDSFALANDSTRSPKSRIYCFTEAPDGSFWLGSLGGGLVRFHPETKDFKLYKVEQGNVNSLPDNFITGLSYDADGVLWVSTTGGLSSYNATQNNFTTYRLSNSNPDDTYRFRVIRSLLISGEKIYLSTYGGLQIFDRITKISQHLIHNPNVKNSLSHNSLFKAVEAADGKLWIATYGGGLNVFDPVTQNFSHWKNDAFDPESLSSNNLFDVYLNNDGLLWVGTADNTVSVYHFNAKKFHLVKNLANQNEGISSGWVRAFLQENDSVFWLGLNGQGINKFNLHTGKADKFLHDPKNTNSLSHNAVSGLSKDAQGNLWIGLEGGGLNKYDPITKKITRYQAGKNSINNNAISAMLVDSENRLWATAYRDGLNILDINQNKFIQLDNDSLQAKTGISFAEVEDILELNGNIWFNGKNQVVLYDKTRNQFVKVAETGRVIQNNNPFYLEITPYTQTEMLLITKDEARSIRYINPDSIVSEPLFKMNLVDGLRSFVVHQQTIWYIKANQLVRWNPVKNVKHIYTQEDGLASDFNMVYKDKQGRIFVSSVDGLNWFYPEEIVDDTLSRKLVFTDFKLFNHSATQKPDSVYKFSIATQPAQLKSVQLNSNHSFFSIGFAAFEFMAPEKIQYAYRLTGFDKDWVHVGNRTFASYTNLDPGTYLFEVKATNPDGYWGNDFATLTLIIRPPFWRTWWFMLLVLLATGALLYAIHRYRLAQSLKLERLRTKIASDLHDEVGSSLTKISIYSELVQNGIHEKEKANYLQSIGSLSREVVSTMSDIVWSIDNNNDTLTELINRMKDFATEVLEAKGIDFEFMLHKTEGNKILEPIVRQSIYLIFKEAINNVVKHAEATHVKVSITTQPHFELRIEDNGIGLVEQPAQSGNGLRNMKRRAESIGGTLTFLAKSGTTVTLQIR